MKTSNDPSGEGDVPRDGTRAPGDGDTVRGRPKRFRLPNDFFFWAPFVAGAAYIAYTILSDPRL